MTGAESALQILQCYESRTKMRKHLPMSNGFAAVTGSYITKVRRETGMVAAP
jgi:hypothetical protein